MNQVTYISAIAGLILIQVLFGLNFPISKIIVTQVDPIFWSAMRFLLAGLGMLILSLVFRRKHPVVKKDFLKNAVILSVFGLGLGQGLFLIGLKHTTSINTAIMTTCIPIFTLVIVILRKQEELSKSKLAGLILAFFGVVFIRDLTNFEVSGSTAIGDGLVLLGTLCFAIYLSFGKKFFQRYDNMWSTTWMFFISGFILLLLSLSEVSSFSKLQLTNEVFYSAIYSIIGATLLTYLLNNWTLKKLPAGNVAVFIYLQPIVAGIFAYFYLGEIITLRMVLCSLLIFLGLILTMRKPKLQKTT